MAGEESTRKEQPTRVPVPADRWYDGSKIIWGLFALIGAILGAWSNQLSASIKTLETRVTVIETDRGSIKTDMEYLKTAINELKIDVRNLHK